MDRIEEMQYHNLRTEFNYVTQEVLGDRYYNEGADVYTGDAFTCRDIIHKFNKMKVERNAWRYGFWFSIIFGALIKIFG